MMQGNLASRPWVHEQISARKEAGISISGNRRLYVLAAFVLTPATIPAPRCEFDILRLQVAPALDFGLVSLFREALKVFRGNTGGRALPNELSRMSRSLDISGRRPAAE